MRFSIWAFGIFVALAGFNAGNMTTLQLQHYAIYPFVGRESFVEYIRMNNRSAAIPSILPAMVLLLLSAVLVFDRPPFFSAAEAVVALSLNLIAFASTFRWQRRLQGEMAISGYDAEKSRLLNQTNWIRTSVFLAQAVLATSVLIRAL